MSFDPSYKDLNRASTERIKKLASCLTDEEMQTRVGEHWTVAITLAHLAFWDRRVLCALDMTAKEGKLSTPQIDIAVNDLSLPFWAAIPAREASRIAIETSEELDRRRVPVVLLSGDHAAIARWRRRESLGRTWLRRPELLARRALDGRDRALLDDFIRDYRERTENAGAAGDLAEQRGA